MINKDMLQHLLSLEIPNTEIAKPFNVVRALGTYLKKFTNHQMCLGNPRIKEIDQILREMQQFHPNMGFRCAVGHLRAKDVKVKQETLKLILKISKILSPLKWMPLDAEYTGT